MHGQSEPKDADEAEDTGDFRRRLWRDAEEDDGNDPAVDDAAGEFAITDTLRQSLSEAQTVAAAKVLSASEDPRLTLRILVAALQAQYQSPARIKT